MASPVPNSLPSFWRTNPHRLDTHRSTPDLPSTTDILIIGAGYSGAACAYYLTKDSHLSSPATPSITILEAREVCSGATGRNGGHVKPDTYFNLVKYSQLYGPEASASIARFESDNLSAVKKLVEEEEIDCDFHLTRAADVFIDDVQAADDAAANFAQLQKASTAGDGGVFDLHDVHSISDPATAERVTGVVGALRAYTFTAAQLWPYKLVTSLLELAIARGDVNLQTNTSVTSISPDQHPSAGYRYSVLTPRGTVRARKVIVCTNAYTASLLPEFASKIIPCRGIAARIVTPSLPPADSSSSSSSQPPLLSTTYALRGEKGLMDYLIHRPSDHSIIVGGARSAFVRTLSSWYGNVDDSELISDSARRYFDGYMQRHFHGWADSRAYVDKVWTGVMGYSADAVPFVGRVPGRGEGGMYLMGGFTGHGMPQILGCARALVEEVLTDMHTMSNGEESRGQDGTSSGRLNGSSSRLNGSTGRLKGLASLPIPFRITEERMQSKMNVVLDSWGRTWDEKAIP